MSELIANLFNTNGFMPHGMCIYWRKDLLSLHVVSDAIIAFSYFAIPVILLYFLHKRKDVVFSWIFVMFAAFIMACGLTHVMGIWTMWHPDYYEQGLIKAMTALVSLATAVALVPLLPKILTLPSPKMLLEMNQRLSMEINERARAEKELADQAGELKSRASELDELNTELTNMNKLFVDREVRMVELKQRINALLEERGEPPEFEIDSKVS
ncbi:MAG: hypothetical protein R3318_03785 [Gammaproteobacteria bacterium]|nr:hypothetical protein [Gammaproteobacteria bacterium]